MTRYRTDLDPGQRLCRVSAGAGDSRHDIGCDRTPEIVDHDVDVPRLVSEIAYPAGIAELDGGVGSQVFKGRELLGVSSGTDDMAGAEALGDLHRHLARAAGGAKNQHRLAGLEFNAPAKSDPRGHRGVHSRSHQDGV